MNFRELFGFQGRIGRGAYALVGILGVLLKHNLDRLLSYELLHQSWGPLNYLWPLGIANGRQSLLPGQKLFLALLAVTSIPFIWLGIGMTLKRLRDAGLAARLLVLFFVPVVNIFFFLFLCALPSRDHYSEPQQHNSGSLARLLPKSQFGISILSVVAGGASAAGLGWFSIRVLGNYGWTLFIAIPFFMGFLSTWLYIYERPRGFGQCACITLLSVCLTGVIIVGAALDGLICLLMCVPLAVPLALLGAYLAFVMRSVQRMETQSGAVLSLFLVIPLMATAEFSVPLPTPQFKTHTSIEISAPPELVWQRIIAFPRIDAPLNPLFRVGISYPLEAQIVGTGLTADRKCIFSSGAFREPILAWEEGKHFAFGVSEEPPLMKELSPYSDVHVRHLDDHDFRPERADFYLAELPGGRTRLDGWTTYQNRMWPSAYWRLWTDAIVHQIHFRVFRQVKKLAEQDAILRARN